MMLLLLSFSMRLTAILIILSVCPLSSLPSPSAADISFYEQKLMSDDTPRAGNFEPLAHLPKNKSVVLGLISSKLAELEDPKQIASRVDEAAKIMGDSSKARICLSPQCGFASHIEGNKVTEQDVEKKLKLVQDIAHQIWSDA